MDPKRPCHRTRNVCPHCQQNLGYTALRRHRDLPHLYCPGYISRMVNTQQNNDSDSSDSTFIVDEPSSCNSPVSDYSGDINISSTEIPPPSPNTPEISDSDSGPEVWDEASDSEVENDSDSTELHHNNAMQLYYVVCLFLNFFQLCYRISDRALSHLLLFFSVLLRHLSFHVQNSPLLVTFVNKFPTTLYTLRKQLKQNSSYTTYIVCPRCHSLYKESECLPVTDSVGAFSPMCDYVEYPNHPQIARRKKCGTNLLKQVKIGQRYKYVPRKVYVYYNIISSLQRLVSRPNFIQQCDEWRKLCTNIPHGYLTDVFDGRLWHEWGKQSNISFLDVPGNLLFMLNIDWFQPFEHTQYSVGVIYLVIQNLPRAVRFKPENVIIVSTIPGPKEPDYNHLNPYLKSMVDDLLLLWEGVNFETPHSMLSSKLIRAALCYISSDLPATRKVCGFYGYHAHYGCSKCLKVFPSTFGTAPNYSGFNRSSWTMRAMDDHRLSAERVKNANTRSARESAEHEAGVRYSELLRLPYLDLVRCHLVDPMHNLFLGTSKRMLTLWKEKRYLSDSNFDSLQKKIDSINPPANIGRIPSKISAGFSGFTAEQWMHWTILYSPVVLRDLLPLEDYTLWCIFSKACSLLCRPYIHERDVEKADELLLGFCSGFERRYGQESCTPNLHMHCHLKECILDAGPLYAFWCFSFERYNGILEKMKKSWYAPELQLIHKFCNLQSLVGADLPENTPLELMKCFEQAKDYKTALPNPVISGAFVLHYEGNILCSPKNTCALKLTHHQLVQPGREKFMMESERTDLQEMYNILYGAEHVDHVPLQHTQFHQIRVFEQMYTSLKSRSSRSSAIIAVWPHLSGIVTSNTSMEDVRVGIIEHFLLHTPTLKAETDGLQSYEYKKEDHLLAYVNWYQDHPQKFYMSNGIVLSATVSEHQTCSSFMPVSRIISRCAILSTELHFDYGEDKVCIAIPLRRHYLL